MANVSQNIKNNVNENSMGDQEKVENEKYNNSKFEIENLPRKKKKNLLISILGGIIVAIIFSCIFIFSFLENNGYEIIISTIVFSIVWGCLMGIAVILLSVLFLGIFWDLEESHNRRIIYEYETNHIQNELQDDIFENSIKMSYKYLDEYYHQTRDQARKGFYITFAVSIVGAFLIAVGIVAMFFEKTEPSYVTCASGVITEFIAAIFFYLYNKTIVSMSKYHNKLVLSQNISIALKVADTLPSDDKTKSKNKIIEELLKDINSYLIKSDSENNKE